MKSKNMNYLFNVEYFKGIDLLEDKKNGVEILKRNNDEITGFEFAGCNLPDKWRELDGFKCFDLFTSYPGLIIGSGNPHSLSMENAIKCGFTFDYVTGIPYVPGSSLKGVLRSFFPEQNGKDKQIEAEKRTLIRELVGEIGISDFGEEYVDRLRDDIFEGNDIFLAVIPDIGPKAKLLEMDYITPHKDILKNPVPINILKIKPNIKMKFCFILSGFFVDGKEVISADGKAELFRQIILLSGIGAKTNVGFGAFREEKLNVSINSNLNANADKSAPKGRPDSGRHVCKRCGKPTKEIPQKPGKYFEYCWECNKKRQS